MLGKTIQAIGIVSAYPNEWPVLIVAPSTARYHWKAEIKQWLFPESVDKDEDIVLVESGNSAQFQTFGSFKFMIVSFGLLDKVFNST